MLVYGFMLDISLPLWTLYNLCEACVQIVCVYIYELYGFLLIPHPVVIWLTWGSMECMYVHETTQCKEKTFRNIGKNGMFCGL
jgi:hypothetical protein